MKRYYLNQFALGGPRLYWADNAEDSEFLLDSCYERISRSDALRLCASYRRAKRVNPRFGGSTHITPPCWMPKDPNTADIIIEREQCMPYDVYRKELEK